MNVRLEYNLAFTAGVWWEGRLIMNNYQVRVYMTTNSSEPANQNVAYERLKHFVYSEMASTIFVNRAHEALCQHLVAAGIKLTTLPAEPVDQILGIMLYLKLNAITENRIVITDVELSSSEGDHMTYIHSVGETVGPFESEGWWLEPGLAYTNVVKPRGKSKVVNLVRFPEWADVGLGWEENPEQTASTVVFADFPRNENK